jgi:AraC-like DNA-binding protein
MIDINKIIINLIVGTSMLLVFLLYLNPNGYNKLGNKWLACFVLGLLMLNIDEFLMYNNVSVNGFRFYIYSLYSLGPLFYFTIIYFVDPTKKWKLMYCFHFIFGVLFILFENNSTKIVNGNLTINKENTSSILIYFNLILMNVVLPLQALGYLFLSTKAINKHERNIAKFSSNTTEIDLKWLRQILYIIIVLAFFFIIYILSQQEFLINSLLLVCLFFLGYNAMKQKEIFPFTDNNKEEIKEIFNSNKNSVYEKKKLISNDKKEDLLGKLLHIMQTEKPFFDSNLSLFTLATKLNISAHALSFLINESFAENFNQYINRYRVEEAKKIILDPKQSHLSIIGIGFEVGFNSKSSFNSTFKKVTHLTPLEYKKQNS